MPDKTQQIRERAYQLWHEQGNPEGLATDHWLQAERELNEGGANSANEGKKSQTGAAEEAAKKHSHGEAADPGKEIAEQGRE
jgi:hypothetical protein